MKLQTLALLALSTSVVQGFAPVAFARGGVAMKSATPLFSEEPKEGEEGGFDLDLEEMFEMFDAADKNADFEKTVDKVKGKKEEK